MSGSREEPALVRASSGFSPAEAHQARRLALVLGLTVVFVGLELAGAILARSQVLLADALHLLLDVVALALSIGAMRLAIRPPTPRFTFGLRRVEPLMALLNGGLVLAVACGITFEAAEDLASTTAPRPTIMLLVAAAALVVHGVSAWLIHGAIHHPHEDHAHEPHARAHGHGHALNLRGVWLHLVGDVMGALVALAAAVIIRLGGPARVDAVGSLLVAIILFLGAAKLLRDAVLVLLDAAPSHLPALAVRRLVASEPGVLEIRELRVWSLGAGHDAVMLDVRGKGDDAGLADTLRERVHHELGVALVSVHVTSK